MTLKLFVALAGAGLCLAQQQRYELGGSIGYGAYRNGSANTPAGTATTGFRNRFVAGAIIGEDMYSRFGGEIRYTYHDGDPFVESGSAKGNIQGQSHSFHYNLLYYFKPREERLRPYIAAGAGAKYYETTGPSPVPQPLPRIVTLAPSSQWVVLVPVGGGVKYKVANHMWIRGEFLDYITPFPKKMFSTATGGSLRGIFHQFTPMFGVSYAF